MPSSLGLGIIQIGFPQEVLVGRLKEVCANSRRPSCDCEVRATLSVHTVCVSWVSRVYLFVPLGKWLYKADIWIGHTEVLGGGEILEMVSTELSLGMSIH